MTLAEIIAQCDERRPNMYDKDIKTSWINEIEGRVVEEIINRAEFHNIFFRPYKYSLDAEKPLLVPDTHADIYLMYLYSKIDLDQSEITKYNNDVLAFNAAYYAYAAEYRRHHMPKRAVYAGRKAFLH